MIRLFLAVIAMVTAVAQSHAQLVEQSVDEGSGGSATAIFAGGCFWCVEEAFDAVEGVISTTSGFIGGDLADPSYEQVVRGNTGHVEAVLVEYDPAAVTYESLLDTFWTNIDPLDDGGQFCDRGDHYRSVIFYRDERQRELAERSRRRLDDSGVLPGRIVTDVVPATEFYVAEDYHQNYYQRNPVRYRLYKFTCGRPARLEELWGTP